MIVLLRSTATTINDNRLVHGQFMLKIHKKLPNEEIECDILYNNKFTDIINNNMFVYDLYIEYSHIIL